MARRNGALFENPTNIVYCQILEAADLIKANVTSLKANNVGFMAVYRIVCK